ncbi:hypothetical protein [Pseudoxanthomonas sp. J35]|uniref:hypothetical protein n=1 Tax=Pseudoxanthomonas sp. J35 TaxID=935852 RepID=UPI0004B034C7|nr:hypothetical protein [Pseudoxanthomonas sp. J35]
MHDPSSPRTTELPAALNAFLRGVERRAFVFLWLQDGDERGAGHALAAAIRAFPGPAAAMPMGDWPGRFWKLLLALPPGPGRGSWPEELGFLGRMPLPARRALLLRQVAGLDEAAAAEAMDLDLAGYQQALAEACPRDEDGAPDAAGWRRQAEAIQQVGRQLTPERLAWLGELHEAALAGQFAPPASGEPAPAAAASPAPAPGPRPPRRPLRWLGVVVLLLALAGAAWYFWPKLASPLATSEEVAPPPDDGRVHDADPIVVEPLPPPEAPATPPDGEPSLPLALQEDPLVADLALLSWYAAGMPGSRLDRERAGPGEESPASPPDPDPASGLETWSQLDAQAQAQLRAAAAEFQALDPAAQAGLRARFAALDAMERRGWLLGPGLGADYAALQPLVGFVPEDERLPLLAALRALDANQRARLGALAWRTPPAERAALRRDLLATAPSQRDAWLEQRERE